MKVFKKNQIVIYVLAFMLVAAGYLNYTTRTDTENKTIQTSSSEEELLAKTNIGDAQLVSASVNNEVNNELSNQSKNETKSEVENETTDIDEEENSESNITIQTNSKNTNIDDYFANSKIERDAMYSQLIASYEKILNSNNSLETQKQSATEEITKINNIKNSIMICENLIRTKGFENNIIFVNGESVSIIVGGELTQESVSQIQNIISREMNAKATNIHISNR